MYFLIIVWNLILVVDCSVTLFQKNGLGGDTPDVFSMLQFIKFMKFIILPIRQLVNGSFYSMCTFSFNLANNSGWILLLTPFYK